jgi:hypothetical protein
MTYISRRLNKLSSGVSIGLTLMPVIFLLAVGTFVLARPDMYVNPDLNAFQNRQTIFQDQITAQPVVLAAGINKGPGVSSEHRSSNGAETIANASSATAAAVN